MVAEKLVSLINSPKQTYSLLSPALDVLCGQTLGGWDVSSSVLTAHKSLSHSPAGRVAGALWVFQPVVTMPGSREARPSGGKGCWVLSCPFQEKSWRLNPKSSAPVMVRDPRKMSTRSERGQAEEREQGQSSRLLGGAREVIVPPCHSQQSPGMCWDGRGRPLEQPGPTSEVHRQGGSFNLVDDLLFL